MIYQVKRLLTAVSHLTTLALLLLITYRLLSNLRFLDWARRRTANTPVDTPRVSVLIPVRNESATITTCVDSLVWQAYPNMEVIALDDHSSDDTGAQLDMIAAVSSQLKVIHATDEPPQGWNGKSYACHRLSECATGDWLLFTDADTQHAPDSVSQGLAYAQALGVDFVSVFPYQQVQTWSERLVVSFIIDFLPLIGLDFQALWLGSSQRIAANGQYMLIRASSYRSVGGHQAIAADLVDDFALARLLKENGYKIALLNGTSLLSCRMYHSADAVWNGFIKNILLGLETSSRAKHPYWWPILFAWGYVSLFLTPYFNLVSRGQRKLALLEIGWLGILRAISGAYLKRPPSEALTTPFGALSVMIFGLAALYRRGRGQKIAWKGRLYD